MGIEWSLLLAFMGTGVGFIAYYSRSRLIGHLITGTVGLIASLMKGLSITATLIPSLQNLLWIGQLLLAGIAWLLIFTYKKTWRPILTIALLGVMGLFVFLMREGVQ